MLAATPSFPSRRLGHPSPHDLARALSPCLHLLHGCRCSRPVPPLSHPACFLSLRPPSFVPVASFPRLISLVSPGSLVSLASSRLFSSRFSRLLSLLSPRLLSPRLLSLLSSRLAALPRLVSALLPLSVLLPCLTLFPCLALLPRLVLLTGLSSLASPRWSLPLLVRLSSVISLSSVVSPLSSRSPRSPLLHRLAFFLSSRLPSLAPRLSRSRCPHLSFSRRPRLSCLRRLASPPSSSLSRVPSLASPPRSATPLARARVRGVEFESRPTSLIGGEGHTALADVVVDGCGGGGGAGWWWWMGDGKAKSTKSWLISLSSGV